MKFVVGEWNVTFRYHFACFGELYESAVNVIITIKLTTVKCSTYTIKMKPYAKELVSS